MAREDNGIKQLTYTPGIMTPPPSCPNARFSEMKLDDLLHPITGEPIRIGFANARTDFRDYKIEDTLECILSQSPSRRYGERKYDIIVAPEYSFRSKEKPLKKKEKNIIIDKLKEVSEDKTLLIPGTFIWQNRGFLFNTCYVFYDGKVIFEYDKREDGGEAYMAHEYNLDPNFGNRPGIFKWEGLKIGIEVCADKGVLHYRDNISDLDMVFLISCGISTLDLTMETLKPEGYGIVADAANQLFWAKKKE